MTRAELIAQARTYLGVRYRHQGRTRDGADCVGLLVAIAEDFGYTIPYSTNYDFRPDMNVFTHGVLSYCDEVTVGDQLPGDIGLFRLTRGRWHTGIFTERDIMLHSSMKDRKVVEHRLDASWLRILIRVYRFKGVTN